MRNHRFEPRFVTYVPRDLQQGELFISMEYATVVHLCACGCGTKTVTPLSAGGWTLTFDGTVTLRPSVGNGQTPCRSHYLITSNEIDWLPPIGAEATRAAIARDQRAATEVHAPGKRWRWWRRMFSAAGIRREPNSDESRRP